MFEWVSNIFGGGDKPQQAAPAPAPTATPAPAQAPAPAPGTDHAPPAVAHDPQSATTANATAAAPDQSKPKEIDPKKIAADANTIFKKMDGWWVSGNDKAAILDTLRNKSPEEVAALKKTYAEAHPGHDMDADLNKHLDGKDLQEAKSSMSGDTVGAAVAAIKNAETGTWRGSVDSDRINTVLDSIKDPAQRAEVAKQVGGELSKVQSGNDSKLTQALLKGDTATASAVRIDTAQNSWTSVLAQGVNNGVFGGLLGKDFGTDKDAINKAIEDCKTPEDRAKLQQQYKLNTGTDLNKDLDKHLDGANRTVATKLLEGDTNAANAAKMKAATEHWFTDKDAIYKAMDGKSDAERKTMMADYKSMYGQDVDKMLDKELSGLDRDKAAELEKNGKMSDAFALKYAQEGSFWSTDKQLIKDTLANKTPDQIKTLTDEYKTKYGIDLNKELSQSTSGRDGFEIKELMKGEPQTLDDKMARARERYDFERGSGSNIVSNAFNDTFSDKGKLLDQQQQRMEDLYKKIQSGQASPEEKALLDRVTGYQNLDTKNYQESKDAVTNGAVAVAAITAGAVATVVTGGAAAPAEAAIIAALAAGGATVITKATLQGAGYSREEFRNDLIMTGVNAATGGTMGALGAEGGALFNVAAKLSDNPVVQQAIIQGASGAVSTGVGNAAQATLAGKGAKDILKAGGMGMLTGGAGGAVTGGVGAGLKGNSMFEGMDPIKAAMLRNAMAGAAGSAVSTGLDPASYQGDSAALLTKWGLAIGGGAVGGAASGNVEGRKEVETAAKVAAENERLAKEGQLPPTAAQEEAITQEEKVAPNPAEVKELETIRKELEAGKPVEIPVEQKVDPTAALEVQPPVAAEQAAKTELPAPVSPAVEEKLAQAPKADDTKPVKVDEPPPTKVEDAVTAAASGTHEPENAAAAVATTPPEAAAPAATTAEKPLTPDQQAVMEMAKTCKSESDFQALRELQREVGLPVAPADAHERQLLVEMAVAAKPEEKATIQELARELDTKNPSAPHDAMADLIEGARGTDGKIDPKQKDGLIDLMGGLHDDAKATDLNAVAGQNAGPGVIDNVEGASLKHLRQQLGTDQMSLLDSMAARGMDRDQVIALFEKLRNTDAGHSEGPGASHLDEHGNPLQNPHTTLSPEEKAMWRDIQTGRFEDMTVGQTEMAKIVLKKDASELATGVRGKPGSVSPADSVGGFVTMAAHGDGLTSTGALQMSGLDSDWHHNVAGFFDMGSNQFTPQVAGAGGGIDRLRFGLSQQIYDRLQVPLGTDARAIMLAEAQRLQAAQGTPSALGRTEDIPSLLQPTMNGTTPAVDANGELVLPHILKMNREIGDIAPTPAGGDSNPFTAWGFSSTRRAIDPTTGLDLPVIPNQELKMSSRTSLPASSELEHVNPTGDVTPTATITPGTTPDLTSTNPDHIRAFFDHLVSLGLTPPFARP